MKINFNDDGGGYVEISNSPSGKIFIVIAAANEDKTKTVNSAEISRDELNILLSDVLPSVQNKKQVSKSKPNTPEMG